MLQESTCPLILFRQWRGIWNVTALAKLNNLSLSMVIFDYCKCRIREIQAALGQLMHTTGPTDHVHKASLVTVRIGNPKCVDEAVLERPETLAERVIEIAVQL